MNYDDWPFARPIDGESSRSLLLTGSRRSRLRWHQRRVDRRRELGWVGEDYSSLWQSCTSHAAAWRPSAVGVTASTGSTTGALLIERSLLSQ